MISLLADPIAQKYSIIAIQESWQNPAVSRIHVPPICDLI